MDDELLAEHVRHLASGRELWGTGGDDRGEPDASDGRMILGAFDGYVRAYA